MNQPNQVAVARLVVCERLDFLYREALSPGEAEQLAQRFIDAGDEAEVVSLRIHIDDILKIDRPEVMFDIWLVDTATGDRSACLSRSTRRPATCGCVGG